MSALENILGMLPDRVGEGKNSQIYTPPHIAEEMVNALPDDIWHKDTTFFDICCKSGIFLYKIYEKLIKIYLHRFHFCGILFKERISFIRKSDHKQDI